MNKFKIHVDELVSFLDASMVGSSVEATSISSLHSVKPGVLTFSKSKDVSDIPDVGALIIVPLHARIPDTHKNNGYVFTKNPRLAFAVTLKNILNKQKENSIHQTAIIGKRTKLGGNVKIGAYSIIGNDCVINDGVEIRNHVTINEQCIIGENCLVKSGAVIGEEGFGFEIDDMAIPIRFPHVGTVRIGNDVEIGCNVVIARGAIEETRIEDHVKIDDQVFIAHNCIVGEKTIITACVEISGSVIIGKRTWIGPNVSIIQKLSIGNDVKIGIGAVVTRDVNEGETIMGINSTTLKRLAYAKKILKIK